MKLTRTLAAATAMLLAGAMPLHAAPECAPRDSLVKVLSEEFGEHRVAIGLNGPASMYELYVSKKGSWTALVVNTNGVACVMASGNAMEFVPGILNSAGPGA